MKHVYSMLDFIVNDIDNSNIQEIKVTIGDTEYIPNKIKDLPVEYLLIVSVTTANSENPIIQITTKQNQVFKQEINLIGAKNETSAIDNYTKNTCYCFTLRGLELLLSPITATDWTTGQAVAGDYIPITAHPTFRGTPNKAYFVYYDNYLKDANGNAKMQQITFNSRGECTLKPDGRIITHIGISATLASSKELAEGDQVLLSDMTVDLSDIIAKIP